MAADAQNPGAKRSGEGPVGGADPAAEAARLQELSRKLLDLWQDHLSAVAQDPNLLAQALKLMTAAPFAWMPGFPLQGGPGFAQPPNPFQPGPSQPGGFQSGIFGGQPAGSATAPFSSGPAAAAAAPVAGAHDVGQLRRRLAELEGRLAQLEGAKSEPKSKQGSRRAGGKAPAGADKPRRGAAKG